MNYYACSPLVFTITYITSNYVLLQPFTPTLSRRIVDGIISNLEMDTSHYDDHPVIVIEQVRKDHDCTLQPVWFP